MRQLSDRIFCLPFSHKTDRPNLGYVRGDRFSLMFDCGASAAHTALFFNELDRLSLPRPAMAVISHWHWDHSFGACALNIPVLACRQTQDRLSHMAAWSWDDASMDARLACGQEIPFGHHMLHLEYGDCRTVRLREADIVFSGEVEIELGGLTCRLIEIGGPHSSDSVICFLPQEQFVFLGDSHGKDLYGKPWHYDAANPQNIEAEIAKVPYDAAKLLPYRDKLLTLSFTRCLPGHAHTMPAEELFASLQA